MSSKWAEEGHKRALAAREVIVDTTRGPQQAGRGSGSKNRADRVGLLRLAFVLHLDLQYSPPKSTQIERDDLPDAVVRYGVVAVPEDVADVGDLLPGDLGMIGLVGSGYVPRSLGDNFQVPFGRGAPQLVNCIGVFFVPCQ